MTGASPPDQAAQMPQGVGSGGPPANAPYADPNAAYNAQFGEQGNRQ
jgi:hypothetical protein